MDGDDGGAGISGSSSSSSVKRVKTAFAYYQSENQSKLRNELGGKSVSMGEVMSKLSERWRNLSLSQRKPYEELEAQDRIRYERESAAADEAALRIQEERRNALSAENVSSHTQRGARRKVEQAREEKQQKKEKRAQRAAANAANNSDDDDDEDEERQERKRIKEQRKMETEQRRQQRQQEERAMAKQHNKLDKEEAKKASQRLEYLLKQSSIFAKLRGGGVGAGAGGESEAAAAPAPAGRAARSSSAAGKKQRGTGAADSHRGGAGGGAGGGGDDEELEEEEVEEEKHVFLSKQPTVIKGGNLKPYQIESLNWMIHLSEKGLNGILADEMGLGKTVQSIAIMAYHYEYRNVQGPHLVCVPKSTMSNWMNELKRWCPSLRAIKFHGSREDREHMIEHDFTSNAAAHDGKRPVDLPQIQGGPDGQTMVDDNRNNPRTWDVCVTTYEVANTERKTLQKFAWKYLIIDEAHRLKNDASMFSKTVRSFRTSNRLLLTGTPLQNNLHELWALLNFLLPDIFSSAEQFDEWFDLEIDDEEAKKTMISQLHKILRPFMLRRLKADVAKGLPPKTETILMVGMSKLQKSLYKKLLLRDLDSITGKSSGKNRTAVLNIVMQLRKCCGHPYLFEGVEDRTLDPLGEHLVENCGKLSMTDKLMKRLKERGSRVLIFTQMTRVLDILEDFMVMRKYEYCRIDGNTVYEDRENSIDEFNKPGSSKFCFLLSTRAGGLGINLQTADTCILYDSDWNPQQDLQAQDRCHRLGQKKPVSIFRLVSENTVEEKIVERAQQKLKLDAMVVQQGRLKEKDKVSKEEMMAAVRFGADTVFRSEESTITDDDIDVILERGKAKTKELAEKLQKADKGDLLDFRLDGGISAQKFEGVDYSDKELRDHLRMLAANSVGKRERRPPPTSYNPIIHSKKSMVVNNRRIKLPKSLRLPQMEDHHFYNRERLLELGKLEFETYAALREAGQLPPKEIMANKKTLLPTELAQEKLDLLDEGFGHWSRSQYFHFVKSCAKYGRDDIASIAADMDMSEDLVEPYSKSFWQYGPTELKNDWERVVSNIERGEKKLAKQKKLSGLLTKFVDTFDNPRDEMTFANKGTTHFALEQDRALLCGVSKHGYGNWDAVREEIRNDDRLTFQHAVQGMTVQAIGKRCDYRMRQMEKELEAREKSKKNKKPPNVIAAQKALEAIKEMDKWENATLEAELTGKSMKTSITSLHSLSVDARMALEERIKERSAAITRLREIEVQVQRCKTLEEETKNAIIRGDQYVNYSVITLKGATSCPTTGSSGGASNGAGAFNSNSESSAPVIHGPSIQQCVAIEATINPMILRIPECGHCENCTGSGSSRKLCVDRLAERERLIAKEHERICGSSNGKKNSSGTSKKRKMDQSSGASSSGSSGKKSGGGVSSSAGATSKSSASSNAGASSDADAEMGDDSEAGKKKKKLLMKKPDGQLKVRVTSQGNKRMTIPDELFPEFCRRISAGGTSERMKVINQFVDDHPTISVRQVTLKFSDVTTRDRPGCILTDPPTKKVGGRAFFFYLRPRYYRYLPMDERPQDWEKFAEADEFLWKKSSGGKGEGGNRKSGGDAGGGSGGAKSKKSSIKNKNSNETENEDENDSNKKSNRPAKKSKLQ